MGRPGIARSRAIQKRKETLLQEYKIRNKSNSFVDRRIGEKDAELSAEDKMILNTTKIKTAIHSKIITVSVTRMAGIKSLLPGSSIVPPLW